MLHTIQGNNDYYLISGKCLHLRNAVCQLNDNSYLFIGATVINLVNVDGTSIVTVYPEIIKELAQRGVNALDPVFSWRKQVFERFGQKFRITYEGIPRINQCCPKLLLSDKQSTKGRSGIGINIGGYYIRIVYIDERGEIAFGPELRLGSGDESALSGWSIGTFCQYISSLVAKTGWNYTFASIAWAAPRGREGIISALHRLFANCPDLSQTNSNTLRQLFETSLGCPIYFWNDGEASAAADWSTSHNFSHDALISLKLGTSIACGVVENDFLYLLPFELGSCLFTNRSESKFSESTYSSPLFWKTLHEHIGAGFVSSRYFKSRKANRCFPRFQIDALAGRADALKELRHMASVITDALLFLTRILGSIRIHLGGKSLEGDFGRLFCEMLHDELSIRSVESSEIQISLTSWPPTYIAAIGAAMLPSLTSSHIKESNDK